MRTKSTFTFRLADDLFNQFKKKAETVNLPMSAIVRILIERYLKGEIGLD